HPEAATSSRVRSCISILPDAGVGRVRAELPAAPVEVFDADAVDIHAVDAAHVDHELPRIGSRTIEGRDGAMTAELVASGQRPELIGLDFVGTRHEPEALRRDEMMQVTLFAADRAVALARSFEVRKDLETHAAAVTASGVGSKRGGSPAHRKSRIVADRVTSSGLRWECIPVVCGPTYPRYASQP